jgi:hypothetical protein
MNTDLQVGGLYEYPYTVSLRRLNNELTPISDITLINEHTPFVVLEVNQTRSVVWLKVLSTTGLVGYVQYAKHLKALTT